MYSRTINGFLCHLMVTLVLCSSTSNSSNTVIQNPHRRVLHQPLFSQQPSLPPTQAPLGAPQSQPEAPQQPKLPFSSSFSFPSGSQKPFFPSYNSTQPPPSPIDSLTTLPANISSLLFPQPSSYSKQHSIIAIALSLSLLTAAVIVALTAFIYYRRHRIYVTAFKASRSDSLRLYPPDIITSDARRNTHHKLGEGATSSSNSEFFYLDTRSNSHEGEDEHENANHSNCNTITSTKGNVGTGVVFFSCSGASYEKLGSPELKPLPPLPRLQNLRQNQRNNVQINSYVVKERDDDDDEQEEFFSPRGSSGRKENQSLSPPYEPTDTSSCRVFVLRMENNHFGSRRFNSRTVSYPYTHCNNSVPASPLLSTTNSLPLSPASSSPEFLPMSLNNLNLSPNQPLMENLPSPPSPPPPPPPGFWEIPVTSSSGPPVLRTPSLPISSQNLAPSRQSQCSSSEKVEDTGCSSSSMSKPKPKLKPLHWDKVRASSELAMVWDQLKPGSFQ